MHDERSGPPDAVSRPVVLPHDAAVVQLLGPGHSGVVRFAALLESAGVTRGLIGPREIPRLWERHLLNSAAVAPFLPDAGTVVDVGTGAGLPGVVLALLRPDLRMVLLEPMERRVRWLEEVREALDLQSVQILRARAEDLAGEMHADAVTARALAPMERLARWTLPLVRPGGVLLALKGQNAAEELADARAVIAALGGSPGEVLSAPTVPGVEPTTVVRIARVGPGAPAEPSPVRASPPPRGRKTGRRASRRGARP